VSDGRALPARMGSRLGAALLEVTHQVGPLVVATLVGFAFPGIRQDVEAIAGAGVVAPFLWLVKRRRSRASLREEDPYATQDAYGAFGVGRGHTRLSAGRFGADGSLAARLPAKGRM
jgi:hypothetical protein